MPSTQVHASSCLLRFYSRNRHIEPLILEHDYNGFILATQDNFMLYTLALKEEYNN